ncbi:biotin transporter BioY [Tepidibacillus sp. LV47]|uniref:biotin transporter BioY n=1 Tax=Tepidibacillus sp. LV47 TaxID=3398228 RepID=UPI003AAC6F09
MKTRDWVLSAMMTAVIAILAQLSIPIGPVPITLSIFGVFLSAGLLGPKMGTISVILYILLGAIGVPVFANFSGGIHVLLGKTGGYLFGYIIATYFIGKFFEKSKDKSIRYRSIHFIVLSLIGLVIIYTLGAIQLKYVLNLSWAKAFEFGVAPFILFDIIKIVIASIIIVPIKQSLKSSNLLFE